MRFTDSWDIAREGMLSYTAVPNLAKLGFEIMAFTFANWRHDLYPVEKSNGVKAYVAKHPNIIFISTGSGLGSDRMAVSLHKDYADYMKFIQEGKGEWGNHVERSGSFIVSLKSDTVLRNLAFAQLSGLFKSEQELGKK